MGAHFRHSWQFLPPPHVLEGRSYQSTVSGSPLARLPEKERNREFMEMTCEKQQDKLLKGEAWRRHRKPCSHGECAAG